MEGGEGGCRLSMTVGGGAEGLAARRGAGVYSLGWEHVHWRGLVQARVACRWGLSRAAGGVGGRKGVGGG